VGRSTHSTALTGQTEAPCRGETLSMREQGGGLKGAAVPSKHITQAVGDDGARSRWREHRLRWRGEAAVVLVVALCRTLPGGRSVGVGRCGFLIRIRGEVPEAEGAAGLKVGKPDLQALWNPRAVTIVLCFLSMAYGWIPHNASFGFLDLAPSILHSNWFWDYIS
jgi:hypothetical protein